MITDYASLQTAIADRLHRKDLSSRIPEFIQLAEAEINRRLTVTPKEIEAPLTLAAGSRFVSLPADFGSPVGLWATHVNPRADLVAMLASELPVNDGLLMLPTWWAVDGGRLAFNCKADKSYPLALRYLRSLSLSDAAPVNDLLKMAPDLYFYGALAQAADHIQADDRAALWAGKFSALLRSTGAALARNQSVALLRTEIPTLRCSYR